MNPDQYPRRILLCGAGLSPQIVTEARSNQYPPIRVPTLQRHGHPVKRYAMRTLQRDDERRVRIAYLSQRSAQEEDIFCGLPETLYALTVIGEPAALNDALADADHPLIAARRAASIPKAFFEERTSKLKRELNRALGEPAAARYTLQRQGSQRLAGDALGLEPRQIQFARLDDVEPAIRNRSA